MATESAQSHPSQTEGIPAAPAHPVLVRVLFVTYGLLLTIGMMIHAGQGLFHVSPPATDFTNFYVAGKSVWSGGLAGLYQPENLFRALREFTGRDMPLLWNYPPQYGLVLAPLGLLPYGIAFSVFVSASFGLFCFLLHRLAGPSAVLAQAACLPAMAVNLISGQNGFLTAALLALFATAYLRRSPSAGAWLGLMVIKPHLAAGPSLLALITRQWPALFAALATVLATVAASTLLLGPEIWTAFWNGATRTLGYLGRGQPPLARMASIYACLMSFGFDAAVAAMAQVIVALAGAGMLFAAARHVPDDRTRLGLALVVSLLMTPYAYDYDLTILCLGLALLLPQLLTTATLLELPAGLALTWLACGWGLYQRWFAAGHSQLSLSGIALAMLAILIFTRLMRNSRLQDPERRVNAVNRSPAS